MTPTPAMRKPSESITWLWHQSGVSTIPEAERDDYQRGIAFALAEARKILEDEGR